MAATLPRLYDQEPVKVPAVKSINLDSLMAEADRRGIDRKRAMSAALTHAAERGIGSMTYQGTEYPLLSQEPAAKVAALKGEPLTRISNASAAIPGKNRDLLDTVRRVGAGRVQQAWEAAYEYAPDDARAAGRRLISAEKNLVFAISKAEASGDGAVLGKLLGALEKFPETTRTRVSSALNDWRTFRDQRLLTFAPSIGEGFLALDGKDRLAALVMIAERPDNKISRTVWDYVSNVLGPEAAGIFAQARSTAQAARLADLQARVGQNAAASDMGNAYAAVRSMRKAALTEGEPITFAGMLRVQLERIATEEGIAFEPMGALPEVVTPLAGLPRRELSSRTALREHAKKVETMTEFFRSTQDLIEKIAEKRYAKEGVEAIVAANKIEEASYRAGLKVLSGLDPEIFDEHGKMDEEKSLRGLQTLLGVMDQDPSAVPPGEEDRVHMGSWFLHAVLAMDRAIGTPLAKFLGSSRAALFIMPDGAVFADPLELGIYLENKWLQDPDRYVWGEHPRLSRHPILGQFGIGARADQQYIKPTIITLDPREYAEQVSYSHGPVGGWKTIYEAITDRSLASIAPDDKIARGIVKSGAMLADLTGDPLNWVTFGVVRGAASIARYRRTLQAMQKAGVELPERAVRAGAPSIEALLDAANSPAARESAGAAAGIPAKIVLPDGVVLNPTMHGKFRVLSQLLGGGESGTGLAGRIFAEARQSPNFVQRFTQVQLANPTFRRHIYDQLVNSGFRVYNPEHAAAIFRDMLPFADRMMRGTSDLGMFGKLQAHWANVWLGEAAHTAAIAKAKGLYIGRLNPFELLRAPVQRAKMGLEAPVQRTAEAFEHYRWWGAAKAFTNKMNQGYLYMKGMVRVGTIPLTEEKAVARPGGGERTAYRSFTTINAPYELVQARRRHGQMTASAATVVEGWMVRWLGAGAKNMRDAARRMDSIPDSAYEDILHALEAPAGLTPGQYLAFRNAVRARVGEIRNAVSGIRSPARTAQIVSGKLSEIGKSVTPEMVADATRSFSVVREQFEELKKMIAEMGAQRVEVGLGTNLVGYAPHMFEKGAAPTLLQEMFEKTGHTFFGPRGDAIFRDSFSVFNMKRQGPPTLLIAEVAGMNYVRDARSVIMHRFDRHVRDMADAIALRDVATTFGWERLSSMGAVRALMDGIGGVGTPKAIESKVNSLFRRSTRMAEDYDRMAKLVHETRRAKAKFDRAVAGAGPKLIAEVERGIADFEITLKRLDAQRAKLAEKSAEEARKMLALRKARGDAPWTKRSLGDMTRAVERYKAARAAELAAQGRADKTRVMIDDAKKAHKKALAGGADQYYLLAHGTGEARLLQHELEQKILATHQAAVEIGTTYALDMNEVVRLARHTLTGKKILVYRRANIERRLKSKKLPKDEVDKLTAELNAVGDDLRVYDQVNQEFDAMGIDARTRTALVHHLYKRPSLYHLTPDEARQLLDRQAKLGSTLEEAVEGSRVYGNVDDATKAFKEDPRLGVHYTKWADDQSKPITKMLSNTYLPVEIVLALRSYGFRIGRALERDAALYAGLTRWSNGFLRYMNKTWKARATVYAPSLHFGMRAQFDAFLKRMIYSGARVFSPFLYRDFNAWRRGKSGMDFVDATGRSVSRMETWEQIAPLFQTFEQRADIVGTVASAGQETAAGLAATKVRRAMKAGDPGNTRGVSLAMAATRGRPPRLVERVGAVGPGAIEAFDNEAKEWIYYMSRRAGFDHSHAMREAFDWGRDFSNLTGQELRVADWMPVAFYNFFKQNTKALIEMISSGSLGRLSWWPKMKTAMEADLPEDLRPTWSNMMDSILTEDGAVVLATDLGAVSFLDGIATFVNVWAKGRGIPEALRMGAQEQIQTFVPSWQLALTAWSETADTSVSRRLRIPPEIAREIGTILSGREDEGMAGRYLMGGITVHVKNGVPSIEVARWAEVALALTGYGVWASAMLRHWDAAENGDFMEWALKGNIFKVYDYPIVAESRMRAVNAESRKMLESMWFFSESGDGGMQLKDSLPPEMDRVARVLLRYENMYDQFVTTLYQVLREVRPGTGVPVPQEPPR